MSKINISLKDKLQNAKDEIFGVIIVINSSEIKNIVTEKISDNILTAKLNKKQIMQLAKNKNVISIEDDSQASI